MLASADNPLGAIPGFNHPKEDFQTVRDVSVIFPAFNEEGNIRCTVETVIRALSNAVAGWENSGVDAGDGAMTPRVWRRHTDVIPDAEIIRPGPSNRTRS